MALRRQECVELQQCALVALSQVCSAGAAERNWKVYSFIHDRRRNRLSKQRAEALVRCHYNIRVQSRLSDFEFEDVTHCIFDPDQDGGMDLLEPAAPSLAQPAPQPPAPQPPAPQHQPAAQPPPAIIGASVVGSHRVQAVSIEGPLPPGVVHATVVVP